jgi:cysteine desulfurase
MSDAARRIYLDHAATTPVHPRVLEEMLPFFSENFGNPSSLYLRGRAALEAVERARALSAELIGARQREILFTSGGTESDNLAIRGVALAGTKRHIITSAVEHHAVLYTCAQLAKHFGFEVTYVGVDAFGQVNPADVARAIRDDTALISIMYANNEVGTIQPIAEIGRIAHSKGIPFHSDAVQAAGALELDVDALEVDFISLSGHKFYGPKGVGILYARDGANFLPAQTGGGQERSRRAGTEFTAGIVGIATALALSQSERETQHSALSALRDRLLHEIPARIGGAQVSGHPVQRLANSASFTIAGVDGEALILGLDQACIEASTGSACTSGSTDPSHVLKAMGMPDEWAQGSLRLTLGRENTAADVERVLSVLPALVETLRRQ